MSNNRKLLAEVDRVLKKIVEGNELFDDIWDKVHSASQQNQKEKYEQDLKKEIKKLQRLREQVKTWAANAEIRNKDPLLDARRSVEERMEKFKELEREMKTKAYSREGLSKTGRLTAEEQAQEDCKAWVADRIEDIQAQLENVEADVESLSSTAKKKAKHAEKIKDFEEKISQHKWHMAQLEMIIRAVDNGVVDPDEVDDIKDDVTYYIESNMEPDFYNDEALYDPLELEERMASQGLVTAAAAAAAAAAAPAVPVKEKKVKKEGEDAEGKKKKKKDKTKKKKDEKESAETDVLLAQQQQRAAILEQQQAAQKARKEKEKLELARQKEEETKRKEVEAQGGIVDERTAAERIAGDEKSHISTGTTAAALAGGNVLPAAGTDRVHTPSSQMQLPAAGTTSASVSANSSPSSTTPSVPLPPGSRQQLPPPAGAVSASSSPSPSPSTVPVAASGAAQPTSNLQTPVAAAALPPGSSSQTPVAGQSQPTPLTTGQHPQQQLATQAQASSTSQSSQSSVAAHAQVPHMPDGPILHPRPTRQITLPGLDLRQKLAMLDSSLLHIPGPAESERTKTYTPRNPFSTPPSFPANPPASFDSAAFMEKVDLDTLFFVFFHQPNTHQQYLAARELKRQSWRYHKKYHTWFQRHEEPRTTTDDYEVGTYVYFDFETNWGQRIKPNFTFEYAFLEDEVSTAPTKKA